MAHQLIYPLLLSVIISWMNVWLWAHSLGPYSPTNLMGILAMTFWFIVIWTWFEVANLDRFPAVYFIARKLDVYGAFWKYKAWAENVTGHRVGILWDDKGGKYMAGDFDKFLAEAGIHWEHSIHNMPQQVGVAKRMNQSISEGITTLLSQSGLTCTWWEDAVMHWLHGKIRLPSSTIVPLTPFELFYGHKPDLSSMRPFSCLAYVHLQKDQHSALLPHTTQCILIGYPTDYKGWKF
jgi:hypothetical protein